MALTVTRAAFFDVDNTLIRGSTLYFLGKGMYQRGYFTKKDVSRFVLANLRFRLTGKENKEEIQRFKMLPQTLLAVITLKILKRSPKRFMTNMFHLLCGKEQLILHKNIWPLAKKSG